MNLEAFIDRLGGRMDDRRAALVDEAFDRLDTSGTGRLTLDEARRYVSFRSAPVVFRREIPFEFPYSSILDPFFNSGLDEGGGC